LALAARSWALTTALAAPRVLVVEDEATIAEVVARYLERAGYATHREHGGPQAVAAARSWDPDLVVLDLMLPGFDGLEVMRQLREAEKGSQRTERRLGIILLTARGEESDRIAGLRRGADDYVVKPFSPAEIVAGVDAVLRRGTPPDAAPRRRSRWTVSRSIQPRAASACAGGRWC
jgi:DNA-binding response OmpR family regulator